VSAGSSPPIWRARTRTFKGIAGSFIRFGGPSISNSTRSPAAFNPVTVIGQTTCPQAFVTTSSMIGRIDSPWRVNVAAASQPVTIVIRLANVGPVVSNPVLAGTAGTRVQGPS